MRPIMAAHISTTSLHHHLLLLVLALLILIPSTQAKPKSKPSSIPFTYLPTTCHTACQTPLSLITFLDPQLPLNSGYYARQCQSHPYLISLASCSSTYCSPRQVRVGWESLADSCKENAGVDLIDLDEVLRLVPGRMEVVDVLASTLEGGKREYGEPILIDERSFRAGYRTERAWQKELMLHHLFGSTMYIFLFLLITLGIIPRLLRSINTFTWKHLTGAADKDVSNQTPTGIRTPDSIPSLQTRLSTLMTKHLLLPRLLSPSSSLHPRPTTPSCLDLDSVRWKTGLVALYVMTSVGFCLVGYETFDENLYWRNDRMGQFLRHLADRTGIMAIWHLPLLWLTATRNDLLIYLTGWSYADFNLLHRWIGRTAGGLSFVHGAVYIWIAREHLWRNLQKEYWYCGLIAGTAMLLLIPSSMQRFRERSYEVFLVVHIGLAMICLVTMFYHVKIFNGAYSPWLWTCVAIWAAERLLRLVRLVLFSWKGLDWSTLNAVAVVEDVEHEHLLRLTVSTSLAYTPKAGTYYFLYFPTVFSPFENHPFTLSGWSRRSDGRMDLHFLIKEQQGVTRKLVRRARRAGNRLQLKVWLEGPYGRAAPLQDYGHLLMIAGGSGIASCLPHIQQIRTLHSEGRSPVPSTSIRLLWIVRTQAYARGILQSNLRHDLPTNLSLEVDIYVTGSESTEESPLLAMSHTEYTYGSDSSTGSLYSLKKERVDHRELPRPAGLTVTYHTGRPRIGDALDASLADVQYTDQRLGVQTCGPSGMMEDLRAALVERYGVGKKDVWEGEVDFWEDGFVW